MHSNSHDLVFSSLHNFNQYCFRVPGPSSHLFLRGGAAQQYSIQLRTFKGGHRTVEKRTLAFLIDIDILEHKTFKANLIKTFGFSCIVPHESWKFF
jgi:hypothetical protein